MPFRAVPGAVRKQGRTDPAGPAPARTPPARPKGVDGQDHGPAALDERLARAGRLGHRLGVTADVRSAVPRSQVQRAVGFELELQVLLSSGAPLEPSEKGEFPWTREDLKTAKRRPQVKETRHTVVLGDGGVFEWREDSLAEEGETVIRPADVQESGAGRWIFKREAAGAEYFDPLLKKEESLHQDELLRVVEDHAPGDLITSSTLRSIPEFVTEPRDEFSSPDEFLKPILWAQELTRGILSKTSGLKDRVPAAAVFPQARKDLYLGYDQKDLPQSFGGEVQSNQSATAGVQATYAVQPASIPRWLEHLASSPRTQKVESGVFSVALSAAGKVMKILSQELLTEPDPGLAGLVHILCLYLSGGSPEFTGKLGDNIKNYAPLLNRAALDTYVKQAGFLGEAGKNLLANHRSTFIAILMEVNGRGPSEPVITIDPTAPKVGAWLEEVLSGTGDSLRSHGRFGRAKQISHEEVGPEGGRTRAPVFEERQVPAPAPDKLREDLVPMDQWVEMALRYQKMLQQANAPVSGGSGASSSQESGLGLSSLPPLHSIIGSQLGSQQEQRSPKKGDQVRYTPKVGEAVVGIVLLVNPSGTVIDVSGKRILIKPTDGGTIEILG